MLTPASFEAMAAALAAAGQAGQRVRIIGAGTKRGWGGAGAEAPDIELSTARLDRIYRHDPADFTALIGAGMSLASVQEQLAAHEQTLALDPPCGETATVGGVFATGDSGPLHHRFGAPRDQILGVTVALADGSIARSGAPVRRNVAGYDLARLFCGSFGTLGVILAVSVRLQPLTRGERTATALARVEDPVGVAAVVDRLVGAPLEIRALDIVWRRGRGGLLAQLSGPEARRRAGRAASIMGSLGLTGVEVTEQDDALWSQQRGGQRSRERALVRVRSQRSQLPALLALSDACGATLVGRAALGISYLELEPARVGELRMGLPSGVHAELLDRPLGDPLAVGGDPWGLGDERALALMRAVKASFDPAGVCNRGLYVGGI